MGFWVGFIILKYTEQIVNDVNLKIEKRETGLGFEVQKEDKRRNGVAYGLSSIL